MTEKRKLDMMQFAIPMLLALCSFALSAINYYENLKREWEGDRPLSIISVESANEAIDDAYQIAIFKIAISNVGRLSFIIRDLELTLSASERLEVKWEESTLIQDSLLPLGFNRFVGKQKSKNGLMVYGLDGESDRWHIVDPYRTVEFQFAVPVDAQGILTIGGTAYVQSVTLAATSDEMTKQKIVRNLKMDVMPESGENADSLSKEPVYLYSFQGILIVGQPGEKKNSGSEEN